MDRAALSLAAVSAAFWAGSVFAISFLEAWLKFRAPGVSMAIGLGIGRLVFRALNRLEWLLAVLVTAAFLMAPGSFGPKNRVLFSAMLVILCLQSVWLLPALDKRALRSIGGEKLPASSLHIYFILLEIIKLILVVLFSVQIILNSDT